MGDPKKNRKKYSTPVHPWQKERIDEEKVLLSEFGLKNKKEIWKMKSSLDHYAQTVKGIISKGGDDSEQGAQNLLKKLRSLGLLKSDSKLDDILSLQLRDLLERRLQTVVFRKGLSRSIKQARQFITHEHIIIGKKMINAPAYLVSFNEEAIITFIDSSTISDSDHPERVKVETPVIKEETKEKEEKNETKK